jgi:site-specific DNA recombinase
MERISPLTQNLKVVSYARVSSKEQDKEGFSIPAQIKLLRGYAGKNRLEIVREFQDVETAKQSGRTGFNEMLSFLKKTPDCRIILVEKTDRLLRNLKDYVTLDDMDLEIHLVKENDVISRDSRSSQKFMHGIKVLMAKNYIDNLSEETRKGMLEKAEQGIFPSYAPLGYRNVKGSDGKNVIVPDPDLAPIVTRMFERYVTGDMSIREVTKMAQAEGMVFRKSKDPVPVATVHKILRNRIYSGDFDWNGKTYHGKHLPLVTRDLWNQVQEVMDHRFSKRHRKSKHDFAFSGLISCGHCGCSLVGEIKKGRYVYYHCTHYKGKCPDPYTKEEILEEKFTEVLEELSFDHEVLEWITEGLRQSHEDEKGYHDEAISRLQNEYTRLQDRIDAMYVDKLDGKIDGTFFDKKAREWREEQDRILRTIEEHQDANQSYLDEGIRVLELAHRAPELFQEQEAREKRRLLNFLLSNCTWKNGELEVTYRQPFDMIVEMHREHEKKKAAYLSKSDLFANWLPE